jgi:DNA (cytosine-5)-methyltransferase 1
MARLGLGRRWQCTFANDVCPKKAEAYRDNFGPADELLVRDVWEVTPDRLPGRATLAWASFPCQDLSLAGARLGLRGRRSGTFWAFHDLLSRLWDEGRGVPLLVLENVTGAITSHSGHDFEAILEALAPRYRYGPLVIDAALFVPQSRPRLFIVAVARSLTYPPCLSSPFGVATWATQALLDAKKRLPPRLADDWIWWRMPTPPERATALSDLIESDPDGVSWHTDEDTLRLISLMSPTNAAKLDAARSCGRRAVGAVYKRTRRTHEGVRAQRAEARFDGVSGCLRTPMGGSSRQTLLLVENGDVRSRLMSPREAARVMGVPDSYTLPTPYNEAYHLMGDGVVVPVVAWLERYLLRPLAEASQEAGHATSGCESRSLLRASV